MPFHYIDSNGELDLDQFIIDPPSIPLEKAKDSEEPNPLDIDKIHRVNLALRSPEQEVIRNKQIGRRSEGQNEKSRTGVAISPNLRISDIMIKKVECLDPDDNLKTAFELFARFKFRHVPITTFNRQLVGIVTDRDILKSIYNRPFSDWNEFYQTPLREIMTSPVLSVTEETPVQEVAEIMAAHDIGALPVVQTRFQDTMPTVLGLATQTDLYKLLVDAESLFDESNINLMSPELFAKA